MKGTDKQIKYANDLIEDYRTRRVEKFVKAGKSEKIKNRIEILEFVENCDDASLIIEILNNTHMLPKEDPVNGPRGIKAYYNIQ